MRPIGFDRGLDGSDELACESGERLGVEELVDDLAVFLNGVPEGGFGGWGLGAWVRDAW
jgi:hypothetical protein